MTAKVGECEVPFVFEMNDAGLSKMEPAWLARLVPSVSTCSRMRRCLLR